MKKIIHIGRRIFCKITIKEGNLSISGVDRPLSNGDCKGSCGQIYDDIPIRSNFKYASGWSKDLARELVSIWKRWHLNDMNASCVHQRENWDLDKKIEVVSYGYGNKFWDLAGKVKAGKASTEEYQDYCVHKPIVTKIIVGRTIIDQDTLDNYLDRGFIKRERVETKPAIHVRCDEHPEGLLVKPCEICGYRYGSEWLKEELPGEVIEFLESLPDTDITPAWV